LALFPDAPVPAQPANLRLRRYRVKLELYIAGSYAVDTLLLSTFAWLGVVDSRAPLIYGLVGLLMCTTFLILMRKGVSEDMKDPTVDRVQRAIGCAAQICFIWLYPPLAFFFVNILFVIFGFSFHQPGIGWQRLALEWGLIGLATGVMVLVLGAAVAPPLDTVAERMLVWLSFVITVARCAYLGYLGSRVRARLIEVNRNFRALNEDLELRVADRTRELRATNDELVEWNRQLRSFAYSVAHDFRQPIIAINGQSALLARKLGDIGADAKLLAHLERIAASSLQMERLCAGLTRLEQVNRAPLRLVQVDVSAMAREVADQLLMADGNRTVDFQLAPGLRAWADPTLLRMALQVLLGNAFKFTSRSADARICVEGAASGNGFSVRDNGAGFDPAYARQLFGLFQRLHTDKEYPGVGIGLALVERVAHRHGGSVTAEGAVDAGARFTFSLPPAAS
jgi:signal transduction histidine kinase